MSSVNIHCPRCQSAQVYRHGQNPKGRDRFRYRDCHRVFQLTYTYQARKPGMKEMITEMAFNGARNDAGPDGSFTWNSALPVV